MCLATALNNTLLFFLELLVHAHDIVSGLVFWQPSQRVALQHLQFRVLDMHVPAWVMGQFAIFAFISEFLLQLFHKEVQKTIVY